MTSAELSYQGKIDINLANVDAVFQDTTSNMFQNITLDKHFDMLYQAQSSKLTKPERRVQLIEMMTAFGFRRAATFIKILSLRIEWWYGSKSCANDGID